MVERLFVYGTLHPSRAPREISAVVRRFRSLGNATVHGRLYDLGEYPAIVLDSAATVVKGELFAMPADSSSFAQLDAYEEYSPDQPKHSLFLRTRTEARLGDGQELACWIYVYNRPLPKGAVEHELTSVA